MGAFGLLGSECLERSKFADEAALHVFLFLVDGNVVRNDLFLLISLGLKELEEPRL